MIEIGRPTDETLYSWGQFLGDPLVYYIIAHKMSTALMGIHRGPTLPADRSWRLATKYDWTSWVASSLNVTERCLAAVNSCSSSQHVHRRLKVCIAGSQSLTDTGRHLPYGITQYYLPPDTSESAPPQPQPVSQCSIYWRDGRLSWPRLPGNATAGVKHATYRSNVLTSNVLTTTSSNHEVSPPTGSRGGAPVGVWQWKPTS